MRYANLIIILAIIVMLVLIVTAPGLWESPKQNICVNNQRELAAAAMRYGEDHGGRTPDVWELGPYVKNKNVFICPKDKRKGLGIDKSSYTACDITPKSFNKEDMKDGYAWQYVLYIESDATHPGHKREEIIWENWEDLAPRHQNKEVTIISAMSGNVTPFDLYDKPMEPSRWDEH
ncbi:MAG: hypothetical protein KKI13_02695 [Candidatus Omnitrophica bacterium]|nr:hypothetical protein [Candidatus Omnitrophota bacterium]MCG2705161.1 hypothetical protein [Candidatus Omnitrophota bacterium]